MKTTLRLLNFDLTSSWRRLLEQHVDQWQRLAAVSATEVVLERQHTAKPGFRLQVRLETSAGPLQVEAVAPSLRAALLEATRVLERQIHHRQDQRVERRAAARLLSEAGACANL